MSALIDRYEQQYGKKKKSYGREKTVLEGIRKEFGDLFVREVDGPAIDRWYQKLTVEQGPRAGHSRAALQRHAPHDGEGGDHLVEGDRYRPESGGPGGGEAAG